MASTALSNAAKHFLLAKSVAVLATVQASGGPLATPMWFVHDDQSISMISEKGLQKVTNLRRDPAACVEVEGEVDGETAGVIVQGQIRFLDAETERAPHVDALHAKYHSALARRWGSRAMPSDRVMFRLEAHRVNTWGLG